MKKIFGRGWSGKGMRDATVAPLVGKVVQVGHYRLKVEAHLGEGGFASIYRVKDLASGELFALKHLRLGSKETVEMVRHEAKVMNRLKGHPNVLRLISVAFGGEAGAETDAYMLLDLCPDNLFRYLQRKDFKVTDARLLEIFGAVCSAVAEMHSLEPPLTHRDVKVENVLRRPNNEWVLCDFGSSTTRERTYETPAEIGEEEENIRRHTTPAYRAPEMWDLYQRKRIDTRVDIWALGCVLYFLSYGKLPFSGDSKLQILNGNYQIPPRRPVPICSLIQDLLCVDPDQRPSIRTVVQRVAALQHYIHNAASNSDDVDSSNHSLTPRDLAPVYSAPGMAAGSTSPMGAPLAQHSKWDQSNARHMEVGLTRQKSTPQPGNPFATAGPIPTPEPADKMSRQMSTPQPLPADKMSRQMSTPQPQGKSSWQTSHDNSCEYRMPAQQGGAVARASERPRSPGWADFDNPPSQHREPQERETMAGAKNARLPTEERQQEAYQAPDRGSQALEALRLRARGLEVENKALQVQVKQLQNVIASQQQTIQDLQQQNQRQQAQFEKAAAQYALEGQALTAQTSKRAAEQASNIRLPAAVEPQEQKPWVGFSARQDEEHALRSHPIDNGVQHGHFGTRPEESGTQRIGQEPSPRPGHAHPQAPASRPLNGAERERSSTRAPSGGKYWESHGAAPKIPQLQQRQTAVADADDVDATHRRIVSDPPPLENWHVEGV